MSEAPVQFMRAVSANSCMYVCIYVFIYVCMCVWQGRSQFSSYLFVLLQKVLTSKLLQVLASSHLSRSDEDDLKSLGVGRRAFTFQI